MIATAPSPVTDLGLAWNQRRSVSATEHRPWPLPERRWFMGQSWLDLLFAHWRVDAVALRRVVPHQLPIDIIDGSAWIGLTPFEVRGFRLRFSPPAPLVSAFPELNVRTYVTIGGKPGVYFLSLDAASWLAVVAARRVYRFPYFRAAMTIDRAGEGIAHRSARRDPTGPPAHLVARYAPDGPELKPAPGSLEWQLTERYCAYTLDESKAVLRAEIHHPPWILRPASAEVEANTMTKPLGIELDGEPLLHLARRQDVVIWRHERAAE